MYSVPTAPDHLAPLELPETYAWLAQPRFDSYVVIASGDQALALELYQWNAEAAAAAFVDVGHLEIALRNAYDRVMSVKFPNWSVDPSSLLFRRVQGLSRIHADQRRLNLRSLDAIRSAKRGLGGTPTHDQVIAATTFGFWAQLTRSERAGTFWNPIIHRAFASRTRRAVVHDLAQKINRFRNRLAHNEPVFSSSTGFRSRLADVERLFQLVHPRAAAWTAEHSRVNEVLGACPIQDLI